MPSRPHDQQRNAFRLPWRIAAPQNAGMAKISSNSQSEGLAGWADIHVCLVDLLASADGAIQIFPVGDFRVPNGAMRGSGPWRLDEAKARALIATVAARNNPLVVDYEHQSLLAPQNGQPAPAAGWIPSDALEWRDDGLYATRIQWTERAKVMIAGGEYRYLSPVFRADRDGYPVDLLNVALTNNPAIDGMRPVVLAAARAFPTSPGVLVMTALGDRLTRLRDEKQLSNKDLGDAAGISESTIQQILSGDIESPPEQRIRGLAKLLGVSFESLWNLIPKPKRQAMTVQVLAALGLAEDADEEAAVAAINALKARHDPDPAEYVPVGVVQVMQGQLAALKADQQARDVRDLVEPALADGRLLPAQKGWAEQLGSKDIAALKDFLATAQPIAALKGSQTGGKTPTGGVSSDALSKDELAICTALGVSVEEFIKTRKEGV